MTKVDVTMITDGIGQSLTDAVLNEEVLTEIDGVAVTQSFLDWADCVVNVEGKVRFNPDLYVLGKPCQKHGHTWGDTGQCLRRLRKNNPESRIGNCVQCIASNNPTGEIRVDNMRWHYAPRIGERFYLETLCQRGHKFMGANLTLYVNQDKGTKWRCYECYKERDTRLRNKNKDTRNAKGRQKTAEANGTRILGSLCLRSHDHEGTGMSLRSVRSSCLECMKESTKKHYAIRAERMELTPGARELGALCKRGHDYECTGKSLRFKRNQVCVECSKIHQRAIYLRHKHKIIIRNRRYESEMKKKVHCVPYSDQELMERVLELDSNCAYCQRSLLVGNEYIFHIEHFIARSQGGSDVIGNIIAACKSCNSSKCQKDPYEWFKRQAHWDERRWKQILKVLGKTQSNYQQIPLF